MKNRIAPKTALTALILVMLAIGSAVAVTRYLLQKPATIDVTVLPNAYAVDLWTEQTEGTIIANIVFEGTWIENDPTNELYPITSLMWLICEDPTGPNKVVSVTAEGLPEGTTLIVLSQSEGGPLVEGSNFNIENDSPYGLQLAISGLVGNPPSSNIQILIEVGDFS